MPKILKIRRGSSIMEYMMVLLFLFAIIFAFKDYILRAFAGRWKMVGDSFGSGKQYDPKAFDKGGTLECFYYQDPSNPGVNYWVVTTCYESCLRAANGFGSASAMSNCRARCGPGGPGYNTACFSAADFTVAAP